MICKRLISLAIVLFTLHAQALDIFGSSGDLAAGEVVVEKETEFIQPYKWRRGKHGALLSVFTEQFYPSDLRTLGNDATYADVMGESRSSLSGLELGYKYNFELGSFSILGVFATGGISGSYNNSSRDLTFSKQGVALNYAFDNQFNEPYVVPYAQVGVHQFLMSETGTAASAAYDDSATALAFNYKFGLLFQLNWIESAIDKTSQAEALRSSGLENAFVDVYFIDHLASSNAKAADDTGDGDPNLYSSGELGFGLKLEF